MPSKKRLTSSGGTRSFHERSHGGTTFRKRALNFSRDTALFEKGDSILIAFSGGPDSTALLHFFLALREKYALRLAVAHVNYALRGKDSASDETFVRTCCESYDIQLFVLHPKAKSASEEALRDVRYTFFEKIAGKHAFDHVAVAHTRDDQAETVLLRLLRGAGLDGLAAMYPKRENIIRPFLGTSRKEVLAYLKSEKIPFRTDRSNKDTRYLRNRVRHLLIPYIEKRFQPNIRAILARTASIIADEQTRSANIAPSFDMVREKAAISFSRRAFLDLSPADRKRTLRALYREILLTKSNPPVSFVQECRKILKSSKNKHQEATFGQLKIKAKGDRITLMRTS
jgi:tRNA(Ile)-lysidine synthase